MAICRGGESEAIFCARELKVFLRVRAHVIRGIDFDDRKHGVTRWRT